MSYHRAGSKSIVLERIARICDARITDMARSGRENVGQLVRQRHESEGVVLVGFGTHHGHVIAASEWGAPMRRLRVPRAREGSSKPALGDAAIGGSFMLFCGAPAASA